MRFLLLVSENTLAPARALGHVELAFAPPMHSIIRAGDRAWQVTSLHLVLRERGPEDFVAEGGQVWMQELS